MARGPKCTVKFVKHRYGVDGQLWYKGEHLATEGLDHPGERELVKHMLMKQCKEAVAARGKPGFDPGSFFRMLDDMRERASRRRR